MIDPDSRFTLIQASLTEQRTAAAHERGVPRRPGLVRRTLASLDAFRHGDPVAAAIGSPCVAGGATGRLSWRNVGGERVPTCLPE